MAPLLALVAVDLLYPMAAAGGLSADPLAALRVLALGALSVCSVLGVGALVSFLVDLRVPMGRPAAVLTVVFHLTLVAVTCEEAGFATDRSEHVAAEAWTDEALGALPPRAAVLVHSPELAWRLWTARLCEGRRPDVLVVPAPLLHHSRVMGSLLPAEPSLAPLLRDFALTGQATEFAMSVLADARPLHVELHSEWGPRMLSHLYVDGAWLRYTPQGLGVSDRKPQRQQVLSRSSPIVHGITSGQARDGATAFVVARTLKEHASVLSLLRMRPEARDAIDRIEQIESSDPFVIGARLRLAYADEAHKKPVELRDLLRF